MRCGPLAAASLALFVAAPAGGAGLFDALGIGGEAEEGPNIERFEPPAAGYQAIVADRPRALALKRSESYGLIHAPELKGYLNRIIERLRPAMPVRDVPLEAFAMAAQPPLAQATPDGAVFVNFGLLRDLDSEDALAFVMAHEVAHILYRHHDADWFVDSQKFAAQAATVGSQLKAAVKGTAFKDSGLLIAMDVATAFSEKIVAPTLWNKDQEDAADRLAADLVVGAGYNIDAAFDVLAVLAQWDEIVRKRQEAQREAQTRAMGEALVDSFKPGDQAGFIASVTQAGTGLVKDAFDAIGGGDHYSAEERVERLRDYVKKNHRYAPREALVRFPWDAGDAELARVLDHYHAAAAALAALQEGQPEEALAKARRAVRPPTEADAMPNIALAMGLAATGDRKGMYRALNAAAKGPEPAFIVYRSMISEQLVSHRFDEVIRLMTEAKARLGDPPHLWPYEIALLMAAGEKAAAYAAATRCRLEEPDMADACEAALHDVDSVIDVLGDEVASKGPETQAEPSALPVKEEGSVLRNSTRDK